MFMKWCEVIKARCFKSLCDIFCVSFYSDNAPETDGCIALCTTYYTTRQELTSDDINTKDKWTLSSLVSGIFESSVLPCGIPCSDGDKPGAKVLQTGNCYKRWHQQNVFESCMC